MNNPRYQCPRCRRSKIIGDGIFCTQFTHVVSEEEKEDAKGVERHMSGLLITRECRYVYEGWNWNCAGFRAI